MGGKSYACKNQKNIFGLQYRFGNEWIAGMVIKESLLI